MMSVRVVIAIITLSVSTPLVLAACPAVDSCYRNTPFEGAVDPKIADGIVRVSNDKLQKMCREWPQVKSCLTPSKINQCRDPDDQSQNSAARLLFTHICGPGLNDYLKHGKCYQNKDLESKIDSRSDAFERKSQDLIRKATTGQMSREQFKNDFCRMVNNEFLGPANRDVHDVCGREAQIAFHKMMLSVLKQQASQMQCTLRETWGPFGGAAALASSLALLLIAAVTTLYNLM